MTADDVTALLDELDQAHAERTRIPSPDSDERATDGERGSLLVDGLWTEDHYPEYSQDDVLRAYRLGAEDQRMVSPALYKAAPKLTTAVRAVLTKCDDMEAEAPIGHFFAAEFRRVIADAMSNPAEAPAPRCRCSHVRSQHAAGDRHCYLAACGCARFRPALAA